MRLITVGDLPKGAYQELRAELKKPLQTFVDLEQIIVKDVEAFEKHLKAGNFTIILDEFGESFNSMEFAGVIKRLEDDGRHIDVFLGGAFGISDEIKTQADLRLSLSAMTMPHDLAHIVFLEQLYRACTINRGKTYHY